MTRLSFFRISTVTALVLFVTCAQAQVTCIQAYLSDPNRTALGIAPRDVEAVVSKVANSIGLSPSGIRVIPCDGVANVQSIYYYRDDIPKGDYILYDPVWVRQVIGNDVSGAGNSKSHDEAIFLFGHELGHLLSRHFTSNSELPRITKEMEADRFGGCAAGALGTNWENVADLISRIRGDFDTDYPSRLNSLATAKAGFDTCSRHPEPNPTPAFHSGVSIGIEPGPGELAGLIARELAKQFERAGFVLDPKRPTIIYVIEVEPRTVGRNLDGPDDVIVRVTERATDPTQRVSLQPVREEYPWRNPNSSAHNVAEQLYILLLPSVRGQANP